MVFNKNIYLLRSIAFVVVPLFISCVPVFAGPEMSNNSVTSAQMNSKKVFRANSLIEVIADPEKFQGKRIGIIGFVSVDLIRSSAVISFNKESLEYQIESNFIYIDTSQCTKASEFLRVAHLKCCRIIGVIDSTRGGPSGMDFCPCCIILKEFVVMAEPQLHPSYKTNKYNSN